MGAAGRTCRESTSATSDSVGCGGVFNERAISDLLDPRGGESG